MKGNYLIQRCTFKEVFDPAGGFDANIRCDYMGSAEFEFGALPKSLRRITTELNRYSWVMTGLKSKSRGTLLLFIRDSVDPQPHIDFINGLYSKKNPPMTKEATYLRDTIDDTASKWNCVDLWWDIEADIMYAFSPDTPRITTILTNLAHKYSTDTQG
jgi:hypothetical protein